MADHTLHKVVAALPGSPEPNAVYFVRTGNGYKQFVTDLAGVARPVMVPQLFHFSSRVTFNADQRWLGWDDQRGFMNENWAENLQTNTEPNLNVRDVGLILPAGSVIKKLRFRGRWSGNTAANIHFRLSTAAATGAFTHHGSIGTIAMNGPDIATFEQTFDEAMATDRAAYLSLRQDATFNNRRVYGAWCLQYDIPATL